MEQRWNRGETKKVFAAGNGYLFSIVVHAGRNGELALFHEPTVMKP